MHRSGTSVLTRALNVLGLSLGRSDDLHFAADNPTGHWESTALIACNDRILSKFGGTWDAPPLLARGWETSHKADELLGDMRATFSDVYANASVPWIWKDPRTSLTLPIWRRLFQEIVVVIAIRHPGAVSASLNRRDRLRIWYGARLWSMYVRAALASAAGLRTTFVHYEDLVADPLRVLSELRENLTSLGVRCEGEAQAASEAVRIPAQPPPTPSPPAAAMRLYEHLPRTGTTTGSFVPGPYAASERAWEIMLSAMGRVHGGRWVREALVRRPA
jgi:hypothetical protein